MLILILTQLTVHYNQDAVWPFKSSKSTVVDGLVKKYFTMKPL